MYTGPGSALHRANVYRQRAGDRATGRSRGQEDKEGHMWLRPIHTMHCAVHAVHMHVCVYAVHVGRSECDVPRLDLLCRSGRLPRQGVNAAERQGR